MDRVTRSCGKPELEPPGAERLQKAPGRTDVQDLWAGEGLAFSLTEGEAVYSRHSTQSLVRLNCLLITLHPSLKRLQASWEVLPEELLEVSTSSPPSCSCLHTHFHRSVRGGAPLPVSQAGPWLRPTVSPAAQLCRG